MLKTDMSLKRDQTHSQKKKMPLLHTKAFPPFQESLDLQIELAGKVIQRGITTGLSSSFLPQASAIAPYQTGCRGRQTTSKLKDSQKNLAQCHRYVGISP